MELTDTEKAPIRKWSLLFSQGGFDQILKTNEAIISVSAIGFRSRAEEKG